ncbi:MAG: acyl-[acyl-carrier-protein]--UDP-N-acetylglucosamine O-acyltransferase [Omnitrophica WOR_2 bacterium RIFCSPHIGHO2_02_FULL_48_11]|nr:MAG: acyl-[acyl-carrier-protein]--UDP-N-acetylglucosamine O-acyltransferase [Omnitrophica WOR_2 bacterium RIFCSPHIGHO2_02_FULL_48_11]
MEDLNIHKTAVVHPSAKLSPGVSIGPYSIIEGDVALGDNVRIGSHCVIMGQTTIGRNCSIFTGAVIGSPPQIKNPKSNGNVYLSIGENNVIREYVTINPGTIEGGGKTLVGNNNLLMAYCHIAHDCIIGNNCVMANAATLAGHVILEDNAVVGGLTGVHQFVRLGRLCMVGGMSRISQDVPPFSLCSGQDSKIYGINKVGLRRSNVPPETIEKVRKAFKLLFNSGLSRTHAIERVEKEVEPCPEVEHLVFFIKTSKRGVCGG